MELWNEICFLVNQYRKPNATERDFHIEAEHLFEKLGWSRYKGEIISQQVIPIGSAQSLKPDIIIRKDGRRIFVTELKKPTAELISRNIDQLISYMLQLRLRFGLLIGDTLHVYYDVPEDNKNPVRVIEVPFTPENVDGAELVSLLQKDCYSDERFSAWCLQKLKKRSMDEQIHFLAETLTSPNGQAIIIEALSNHLGTSYPSDVVSSVLDAILIRIDFKQQAYPVASKAQAILAPDLALSERQNKGGDILNIELNPPNINEFKRLLLKKKYASIIIYYTDGREEKRTWDARNFNESSNVMGNLRSRPEFRQKEWQRKGIAKVLCVVGD